MVQKIGWLDNLRAVACLMVIMIHTTTWYLTNPDKVSAITWDVANLLNSASRFCVPLFFMISGYLFFGERSAQRRHFVRIIACLLFYSLVSLLYTAALTPVNSGYALLKILQRPVFYHLWFFYAIIPLYLLSPLIQVKATRAGYLLVMALVLGVVANPGLMPVHVASAPVLPINLYLHGDAFYYLLYALMGRALGELDSNKLPGSGLSAIVVIFSIVGIALGTHYQTAVNGAFAGTWYQYSSPLVLSGACGLFLFFKQRLTQPRPWLSCLARYSLPVYGFHALFIHFMRSHHFDFPQWPWLDIPLIFTLALTGSLLLAIAISRVDKSRYVS